MSSEPVWDMDPGENTHWASLDGIHMVVDGNSTTGWDIRIVYQPPPQVAEDYRHRLADAKSHAIAMVREMASRVFRDRTGAAEAPAPTSSPVAPFTPSGGRPACGPGGDAPAPGKGR